MAMFRQLRRLLPAWIASGWPTTSKVCEMREPLEAGCW